VGVGVPETLTFYIPIGILHGMDNRSNILAQALALFASRGYEGVGVQEIVDAASITKPTLYHYFGSKEGLLTELFVEHFEPFLRDLRKAASYERDLPLTLDRVSAAYFFFARNNRSFYRMLLALIYAPPESKGLKIAAEYARAPFEILEDLFLRASHDHGNMKGRHKMYAITFIGMVNNYITLFLNGYLEITEQMRHQAVHQFQHGIYS
jgi:AcrR family transcriptional regulator